jgi:signal transduction histidine kinase
VRLGYTPEALRIEVTDDGTGGDHRGPAGHGLIGMRERATVYGGTLDAGPADDGGFRVAAVLPLGDAAP